MYSRKGCYENGWKIEMMEFLFTFEVKTLYELVFRKAQFFIQGVPQRARTRRI